MEGTRAPGVLRRVAPLTLGRGAVDLTQGAIPAVLPYLVARHGLGYVEAGMVGVATTVASSIVQPFFGLAADSGRRTWLLWGGALASAGGLALSGVLPSVGLVLAALFVSGLGIAAFHPEGARAARALVAERPAAGMSLFSVGGNIGVALGPLLAGVALATWGLEGTVATALPALALVPVVWWATRHLPAPAARAEGAVDRTGDRPRALAGLVGGVFLRGFAYYGLMTFVPLHEHDVRGRTETEAAVVIGLFLVGGVLGTLTLGRIADRLGPHRALAGAFALVAPLVATYLLDDGPLGIAALVLAGACLIGTFSVSIVVAQGYLPSRVATASGILLGVGIGAGALAGPLVGLLADARGLDVALWTSCGAAVLGTLVLALLPSPSPVGAQR